MLVVKMNIVRLDKDLPLPAYQTEQAAGLDLHAVDDAVILPEEIKVIKTGVKVEIPEGFEGTIRGRSGLAFKHRIYVTHIGTIDADYRGELLVMLTNRGSEAFTIRRGDRIGQLIISPVARVELNEVTELGSSQRGDKGFGSTGTN